MQVASFVASTALSKGWVLTSVWQRRRKAVLEGSREMEAGGRKKFGRALTASRKAKRAARIKDFVQLVCWPISLALKFQ